MIPRWIIVSRGHDSTLNCDSAHDSALNYDPESWLHDKFLPVYGFTI